MTGDKSRLTDFVSKEGGYVTFRDNNKGRIMGEGNIRNQNKTQIKNLLHVNYSRFTWTLFFKTKNEAFDSFRKLATIIQNEKGLNIVSIRSGHGVELQNEYFENFCQENVIHHNFSTPRTPQQNSVVEKKNRSLEEEARTLLNETKLPKYFCADVVSIVCYTLNKLLIIPILKKTPYQLYKGRKPYISHLMVFGCKCFILNNGKKSLGKFDAKANDAIFLGY